MIAAASATVLFLGAALCRKDTLAVLVLSAGVMAPCALGFLIAGAFFMPAFFLAALALARIER